MATLTKILIVGDAYEKTGYARVIESIFTPLASKYKLLQLATRYQGQGHDYLWDLLPANAAGDPYGFNHIGKIARDFQPDIIFILYDINYQGRYLKAIKEAGVIAKVVCYSSLESGPLPANLLTQVQDMDLYVVFTEFAKQEIHKTLSKIRKKEPHFLFPELVVIPHGINTHQFYPLNEEVEEGKLYSGKTRARKMLGLHEEAENDAFIVLNANRNMLKKRLDITLEGFSIFAKNKPENVKIYLHTAVQYTGWNIILLAERFGIKDRLILSTGADEHPSVSTDRLNVIYNACDVGINTSINEGWGLISFEHAATGRPQIVPNHSCLSQLWKDSAILMDPTHTVINRADLCDGFVVSAQTVAKGLEQLYQNPQAITHYADSGYKNATQTKYHWDRISKRWDAQFSRLVSQES